MPIIFAFVSDDKGLEVFEDEMPAISSFEGIDVQDVPILFWDASGQPLKVVFDIPNKRGKLSVVSGEYRLEPGGESAPLLEVLDQVSYVDGPNPFVSIDAVRQHLTSQAKWDAESGTPD